MAQDIKAKAPTRAGGGKPGVNPLFAGIVIGLLLGIFLALGVAIWLNRASNPFVEKSKPVEALPAAKSTPPAQASTPSSPAKADGSNPEKPRFEFYQLLPGDKDAAPKDAATKDGARKPVEGGSKPGDKTVAKDVTKDGAPAKDASQTRSIAETLYLQAGAFQSETEAENLKVKIAFAGFEANITQVNAANKGTLFRVRLGPYRSQDEVNRIKGVLSQNGISTAVVKPE